MIALLGLKWRSALANGSNSAEMTRRPWAGALLDGIGVIRGHVRSIFAETPAKRWPPSIPLPAKAPCAATRMWGFVVAAASPRPVPSSERRQSPCPESDGCPQFMIPDPGGAMARSGLCMAALWRLTRFRFTPDEALQDPDAAGAIRYNRIGPRWALSFLGVLRRLGPVAETMADGEPRKNSASGASGGVIAESRYALSPGC